MSRRRKKEEHDEDTSEETSGISLDQLHEIAKRRKIEREEIAEELEDKNSEDEGDGVCGNCVDEGEVAGTAADDEGLMVLTQHEAKGRAAPMCYQLPSWVTQYCQIKEDIIANSVPLESFDLHHKATVMPDLINSAKGPLLIQPNGIVPSDVCVCAPTGCGKTLTYVVPIVNALMGCTTCKLRALVVVPSQDLALQVESVFKDVAKGSPVKIGVFCGQHTLDGEMQAVSGPLGSKVDVLVCTPGRLVSHLQHQYSTLSLCDLRFMVVDEADRIFDQCYHNWLTCVVDAVQRPPTVDSTTSVFASSSVPFLFPSLFDALPKLAPPQSPSSSSFFSPSTTISDVFSPKQPLQKMLFSATLSLDPEKLSLLHLQNPKLYSVSPITGETIGEALLPSTLSEYSLVCKPDYKPLCLLHILRVLEKDCSILCFTHSKVSTHRLKLVLQQYKVSAEEVSANVSQEARKAVLNRFASGKITVLVCSDGMSRGMDVPSVDCVVNYDAPAHFKSYLHRVGRTARAGAKGKAYTILTYEEVTNFNRIVRTAQRNEKIKRIAVSEKDIKPYKSFYSQALENVSAIVQQ